MKTRNHVENEFKDVILTNKRKIEFSFDSVLNFPRRKVLKEFK